MGMLCGIMLVPQNTNIDTNYVMGVHCGHIGEGLELQPG